MLNEIFHKNRKIIKFGLLSSYLTSMNRVGKDNKQKKTKKTQYNSFDNIFQTDA